MLSANMASLDDDLIFGHSDSTLLTEMYHKFAVRLLGREKLPSMRFNDMTKVMSPTVTLKITASTSNCCWWCTVLQMRLAVYLPSPGIARLEGAVQEEKRTLQVLVGFKDRVMVHRPLLGRKVGVRISSVAVGSSSILCQVVRQNFIRCDSVIRDTGCCRQRGHG